MQDILENIDLKTPDHGLSFRLTKNTFKKEFQIQCNLENIDFVKKKKRKKKIPDILENIDLKTLDHGLNCRSTKITIKNTINEGCKSYGPMLKFCVVNYLELGNDIRIVNYHIGDYEFMNKC